MCCVKGLSLQVYVFQDKNRYVRNTLNLIHSSFGGPLQATVSFRVVNPQLHSFLAFKEYGDERSASRPGRSYSGEGAVGNDEDRQVAEAGTNCRGPRNRKGARAPIRSYSRQCNYLSTVQIKPLGPSPSHSANDRLSDLV